MKNTFKLLVILSLVIGMTACNDKKDGDKKDDDKKTEASVKGKWSEADLKKANDAMKEADADLAAFGEYKQEFIDCYLSKIESNYASFADADKDHAGCEKYAMECATALMDKIQPEEEEDEEEGEEGEIKTE